MRLEPVFDSFYLLSSVWGFLIGAPVCTANPDAVGTRVATRTSASEAAAGVTAFVNVPRASDFDATRRLP